MRLSVNSLGVHAQAHHSFISTIQSRFIVSLPDLCRFEYSRRWLFACRRRFTLGNRYLRRLPFWCALPVPPHFPVSAGNRSTCAMANKETEGKIHRGPY